MIGVADSALLISELTARPSAAKHTMPSASPEASRNIPPSRGTVPNASQPTAPIQAAMASVVATVLTMCPVR